MRTKTEIITKDKDKFMIGKANILKGGRDVTIIACGEMVAEALKAAEELQKHKISAAVVNMHTIKPLDRKCVIEFAKKTGAIVTAEDHQIAGGLGSAVSEIVTSESPCIVRKIGVEDRFGQSGTSERLMKEYKLTYLDITVEARKAVKDKTKRK
jgi:transketolase